MAQADKMRAKATKTVAAQNMARRAEKMLSRPGGGPGLRQGGQGALPHARLVRQDPADRQGTVQVVRLAGDLLRRGRGRRPGLPGGHPRPQRRRQDHAAADARRPAAAGHRRGRARARAAARLLRPGARDARRRPHHPGAHALGRGPEQTDTDLRKILGAFLFTGDDVDKPAGVLSGGEKTRLALATLVCSGANVLLLDEPTNNLDPVSREQVLDAIARYPGAIVLVTHDPGAVHGAQAGPGDPAARRRRGRVERRPAGARRARLIPRSP